MIHAHAAALNIGTLPDGRHVAAAYVHRGCGCQQYLHVTPASMLCLYAAMEAFMAGREPTNGHEDDAQSDEAGQADLHWIDEGPPELPDESIESDDAALAIVLGDVDTERLATDDEYAVSFILGDES